MLNELEWCMTFSRALDLYCSGAIDDAWALIDSLSVLELDEQEQRSHDELAANIAGIIRSNIAITIDHLQRLDYLFCWANEDFEHKADMDVWRPPTPLEISLSKKLAEVGGIGTLGHVWLEKIGRLDLIGYHASWGKFAGEPLVVHIGFDESWVDIIDYMYHEDEGAPLTFGVEFSPDSYHKENVSGGPCYEILGPTNTFDSVVDLESGKMSFRTYLNTQFKQGCLPAFKSTEFNEGARTEGFGVMPAGVQLI